MAVKWWMDDAEIANSYRMAADKRNQIRVLADLNATKPAYVRAKLAELGCLSAEEVGELPKKKPSGIQIDEAEARSLLEAGTPDAIAAEQLGVSVTFLTTWRREKGIFRKRGKSGVKNNVIHQNGEDASGTEVPEYPADENTEPENPAEIGTAIIGDEAKIAYVEEEPRGMSVAQLSQIFSAFGDMKNVVVSCGDKKIKGVAVILYYGADSNDGPEKTEVSLKV